MVDRLEAILVDHHRRSGHAWLEIYHRAAWIRRVELRNSELLLRAGHEDGVAVRFRPPGAGAVHFGAASGAGITSVSRALALATPAADSGCPPKGHPQGTLIDRDDDGRLVPCAEMEDWLRCACERVGDQAGSTAWVEVAVTHEAWVASDGVRASRRRTRAWSLFRSISAQPDGSPVLAASRGWPGLTTDAWRTQLEDRGRAREAPKPTDRTRLILLPEAAAKITQALVPALHGTQEAIGESVGPGWDVSDEPRDRRSLFGGEFDDSLTPTQSMALAGSGRILFNLGDSGHARRASYRDPPIQTPSHLVVHPPKVDPIGSEAVAAAVRIHPIGREWLLEISPGPGWIRTSPTELAKRCLGGIGAVRDSYLGVTAPSLVFADLAVRW